MQLRISSNAQKFLATSSNAQKSLAVAIYVNTHKQKKYTSIDIYTKIEPNSLFNGKILQKELLKTFL